MNLRGSFSTSVECGSHVIYNLVVSIQFLNKPYDKWEYSFDIYEALINRISVEWHGVALTKILESHIDIITDLSEHEANLDK